MLLRKTFMILVGLTLVATCAFSQDSDLITVLKKGVTHKFAKFDDETDYFTSQVFQNWDNERFEVLDQVKDLNGVAIDIGAWIGTTSIWLSKNFQHVISVECDRISLTCLEKNLQASECTNVDICNRPLAATSKRVIFGPRGNKLNESISCIKNQTTNVQDYLVRPITLKQLLCDYVYANYKVDSKTVSFIKCDIEGGEEDIIEDILYFCYHNNCAAYVSFHLDWWESHKIRDFDYLFKHFETNCPTSDLCGYLERNPFASILFKPMKTEGLIKKNVPAVIIGYNLVSYIRNMVNQLKKYTSDIIVIDNNSTFPPLLDYYHDEFNYTLIKMNDNYGYRIYEHEAIQKLLGDIYILTDPDLQFNDNLPDNFISDFIDISNYFESGRVGFALSIDSDDMRTDVYHEGYTIIDWEIKFWQERLNYPPCQHMELYSAPVDTTFCLINKKFCNERPIRVAGDYTCLHLPWYKNHRAFLQPGEYESYLHNNWSTNWFAEE